MLYFLLIVGRLVSKRFIGAAVRFLRAYDAEWLCVIGTRCLRLIVVTSHPEMFTTAFGLRVMVVVSLRDSGHLPDQCSEKLFSQIPRR